MRFTSSIRAAYHEAKEQSFELMTAMTDSALTDQPGDTMSPRDTIIIRSSNLHDAPALNRLAALDSAPALTGTALVAEVDGVMRAALPMHGGRAVADPFAETVHLVELLRAHAAALDTARPRRHRLRRLAPAAA